MTSSWRQALGDHRLLVSGFGRWGGGIYDLTGGTAAALDNIPTSGLALGGGRLWRALRAPGEQTAACEVMSYDERGLRTYERHDTIRDPHDICWHDDALHVASSWDGVVWRTAPGADPTVAWQGGTVPDSWHINSLVELDGRLHVCAFGRYDRHKAWRLDEGRTAAVGFVHDTWSGIDVLRGLSHPHHPRRTDDGWLLCESTYGTLTELDHAGEVVRRAGIGRFSRGLAVVGDWAIVGGNAHRDDEDDRAEIVVVDRRSFLVVDRIPMPCLEVYDILAVPFDLARGVAIGFGANPARAVEQHRGTEREATCSSAPDEARVQLVTERTAARLATVGRLLDSQPATRCKVRAEVPATLAAGQMHTLAARVVNRSGLALATVPPHPIRVGARWIRLDGDDDVDLPVADATDTTGDTTGDTAGDGDLTGGGPLPGAEPTRLTRRGPMSALPRVLHPDDRVDVEVLLVAPDEPGRYEVRVALHQTGRGWFGRRTRSKVTVTAPPPPPPGTAATTPAPPDQARPAEALPQRDAVQQPAEALPQRDRAQLAESLPRRDAVQPGEALPRRAKFGAAGTDEAAQPAAREGADEEAARAESVEVGAPGASLSEVSRGGR